MTPAHSIDAQIDDRGRNAGTSLCGGGNRDHRYEHHDIAGSSSLRHGRGSKARSNCRGVTASALSFSVRSVDLDVQTAIRVRQAAGLLPEQAAALVLDTGHHVLQDTADVPEVTHLEPHSSAVRYVPTRSDGDVGSAQKSVGDYQNVDC